MGKSQSVRYSDVRRLMRIQQEQGAMDALSPDWGQYLLTELLRIVPAQLGFFAELADFRPGGKPRTQGAIGMGWLDERSEREFQMYVASDDAVSMNPVLAASMQITKRLFARRRIELVDDDTWQRSTIVNTLLQVSKVDDNIISVYRVDDLGTIMGFGLFRAKGDRVFDVRERRLVQLLLAGVGPVYAKRYHATQRIRGLPPRLRQVLDRLLAGDGEKQIAFALGLSRHTVHDYIKELHRRFDVSSRSELLLTCLRAAGQNHNGGAKQAGAQR